MAIKVVVLFQLNTLYGGVIPSDPIIGYQGRSHIGGWSEMMWFDGTYNDCITALRTGLGGAPGLLPARALLLPISGDIIGVRLYQGGSGKGQSLGFAYPGSPSVGTDVPQMAILCKTGPLNVAVARRFTLRGIPDTYVSNGEFNPVLTYAQAVSQYFHALSNFSFYGINPASPQAPIFSIAGGTGLVTLNQPVNPLVLPGFVTVSRAMDAVGQFHKFTAYVTAVGPGPNQFTMPGWTLGNCTGGTASQKVKALYSMNFNNSTVVRAVVRKVGRPFEQYRGRRAKRRKTA